MLDIVPTIEHFERAIWLSRSATITGSGSPSRIRSPNELINASARDWLASHTGRDPASPDLFRPEALADYYAAVRQPEMMPACARITAPPPASTWSTTERARAEGIKVRCPMLVLWGSKGKIATWYDALGIWRDYCANEVVGGPINSGHYIAEESPAELLEWFDRFF